LKSYSISLFNGFSILMREEFNKRSKIEIYEKVLLGELKND